MTAIGSINGIMSIGVAGMARATERVASAAQKTAGNPLDERVLLDVMVGESAFTANIKIVQAADEMLEKAIDIVA